MNIKRNVRKFSQKGVWDYNYSVIKETIEDNEKNQTKVEKSRESLLYEIIKANMCTLNTIILK